jgi:2-(1,2-epoxy-1,2-dihydrophenyl)acetyl-CoA isomerase
VILVTGAGKAFCSGGDIQGMGERKDRTPLQRKNELAGHVHRIPLALESVDKPVIAAINGAAAGAGLDLALQCDLRYAAASARLGETYVRVGLVPGAGGTWFLPRLVGDARARGLALTAEPLPAEKAEAWGLIWKAVDDGALMAEAEKLCAQFAAVPAAGLGLIKRALDESWSNDLETQLELERELQREASLTPDYAEAVRAFLEKRAPRFTGRGEPL